MTAPAATPQLTVAAMRRRIADTLRRAGIESPALDARLLVGHALGLGHAQLASAAAQVLSASDIAAIEALAARRLAHEPVARIVGRKEFWGLELQLADATLVPRPETETVVEAALAAIGETSARNAPLRIVDLGTGTGAILFALLHELPQAFGVGIDVDPRAVATARDNAHMLGLQGRCCFAVSDFAAALRGAFDLVVSNPPYIATSELPRLAPEVRDYDPPRALDGGKDGLDCYRRIAAEAARLLAPNGRVVLEIGAGQSAPVSGIFETAGLVAAAPARPDLAGIPRALVFRAFP